jgi:hypothetical protein
MMTGSSARSRAMGVVDRSAAKRGGSCGQSRAAKKKITKRTLSCADVA